MQWLFAVAPGLLFLGLLLPSLVRMQRRVAEVNRRAAQLMLGRRSLTAGEFADEFFAPQQRPIAKRVHELLSSALTIDATKILPTDRLVADLCLAQIDGMDVNFLLHDIEQEFGVNLTPRFAEGDLTVGDLIKLIAT